MTLWTRVNGLIWTTGQLIREISAPIRLSMQENHIRRKMIYEHLSWALFVGGGIVKNSSGSLKQPFDAETCWRLVGCWWVLGILQQKLVQIFMLEGLCFPTVGLYLIWWWFRKAVGQELPMRTHSHIHTHSLCLSQTYVQTTSAAVCWVNEQHAVRWPSSAPSKPGPCQRRLPLFVRDLSEITLCMITKILFFFFFIY